jgi:hypothetical protein
MIFTGDIQPEAAAQEYSKGLRIFRAIPIVVTGSPCLLKDHTIHLPLVHSFGISPFLMYCPDLCAQTDTRNDPFRSLGALWIVLFLILPLQPT